MRHLISTFPPAEFKLRVFENGMWIQRAGFVWFEDMKMFTEGRTSRKVHFWCWQMTGISLLISFCSE